MIHMQHPNQLYIFDPWRTISPKRRLMLDAGWPELFREHILPSIPVEQVTKFFDRYMGRPSKEFYSMLGALILQQVSSCRCWASCPGSIAFFVCDSVFPHSPGQ
jgi:hypothetical protein